MRDKDILNVLGLNDRTITLTADDEYLQIMLEKKIDNYLKKIKEEKERKKSTTIKINMKSLKRKMSL